MSEPGQSFDIPHPQTVEAEGFLLRPYSMDDLEQAEKFADDPLTVQWAPMRRGGNDVAHWISQRVNWDGHMTWWAADDHDQIFGGVSVFQFDYHNANVMLGYWVAPHARGRGVAARAAKAASAFTFANIPVARIGLFHAVMNEASCKAATRAGFEYEGTLRKSWRYPDGELHDEHVHGLLRP